MKSPYNSRENHNSTAGQMDAEAIAGLARGALDDSIGSLDAATLSRLNRARQLALDPNTNSTGWIQQWQQWLPASAAAAAVALAVILPLGTGEVVRQVAGEGVLEQAPLIAEDPELLEDLDMVLWLLNEDIHAS